MKSAEYWAEAALHREAAVQDGATVETEKILRLYDEALEDIQEEIETIIYNFRKRYGIDRETAVKHLARTMKDDNLNSLVQSLLDAPNAEAREKILDYIHLDGLSVRAYAARIERYAGLKSQIYTRITRIAAEETTIVDGILKSAYKESYYGLIDDTAKGFDVGINFSMISDRAVEAAVNEKWYGKRFSERIWTNTDRLAKEAQELVIKSVITGEAEKKTAAKLAEAFEVEKYHAVTLVRTETAHIHSKADMQAYKDLGIEEYKYLATLDYRTCETCQPLDGKVFKVADAREGVNYPSMHPRCRCTTTMNIDYNRRSARNPISGKSVKVDGSTTYKDWINGLSDEERQALELAQRKDSRAAADKVQYAKYVNTLGTETVPKTFDKFQELKYTDSEKWAGLKLAYKDKNLQNKIQTEYNLNIFEGRQGKHILGHNNYIDGRSYLTISMTEAQGLVNKYAGTGVIDRDRYGKWTNKEMFDTNKQIGVILNSNGEKTPTSKFTIHYSKEKGTHIVPGAKM